MKLRGLVLTCAMLLLTFGVSGQSAEELRQMALASGMSEAQINQAIGQSSSSAGSGMSSSQNVDTRRDANQDPNGKNSTSALGLDMQQRGTVISRGGYLLASENELFQLADRIPIEYEYYINQSGDTLRIPPPVFGRDIFRRKDLTFAPDLNIPTPVDYQLSSGDEVRINVWGNSELDVTQMITPEGLIYVQDLGPIQLSGLTVDAAEAKVKREMSKIVRGLSDGSTSLSLSLGKIRSINVNVVGEAYMPGTYTVPSLSTLFNVLYLAGGVNELGSLRAIKLYRNDEQIANLDVYDYLFNGRSNSNVRLESGDMIIVEPYESLVTAEGELKRNNIFEMKSGETLADLINMAGGFKGSANTESVKIDRKRDGHLAIRRVKPADYAATEMYDGDVVKVDSVAQRYLNRLDVEGAVWYPGIYELSDEVHTVKQLIAAASGLKGDEFMGRAQITRLNPDFSKSVIAVDIKGIMNGLSPDVELLKDDVLYIPSITDLREDYTITVMGAVNGVKESEADNLKGDANRKGVNSSVNSSSSDVVNIIDYKYNMTVEDAIILAGGLRETAAMVNVDIARRVKNPLQTDNPSKIVDVFTVQLVDGLALDPNGQVITLDPFDQIYVRYSPGYREQEVISVDGEVLFRGDYVLKGVNSRLSDVLRDAGGVNNEAYVRGASLTRKMTEDEMIRVQTLLDMQKNSEGRKDSLAVVDVDMITDRYAVGINLEKALQNPGSLDDIVLRDGDKLYIPKQQSTVKINGAVVYPNNVTYVKKYSAKDYVNQAGGYAAMAKRRPIVIYMNGQVKTAKRVLGLFKKYPKIEAGCEVLIPEKPERDGAGLAQVMSLTTSAVSMAAVLATIL